MGAVWSKIKEIAKVALWVSLASIFIPLFLMCVMVWVTIHILDNDYAARG